MYIEVTKKSQKGKIYTQTLIRESYREGKKVKHRTIANITKLPKIMVEQMRVILKNKSVCFEDIDNIIDEKNREYGASFAFLEVARSLNLDKIIYSRPEQWRNDIMVMIVGRIVYQGSKLHLINTFSDTALWELCGHEAFKRPEVERHCYKPLDKLLKRQDKIEKTLASKHLKNGCMVLYDITNLYAEGEYKFSELLDYGKSKEKKKGFKQVSIGLITDSVGRPIAVKVFRGNTSDQTTVKSQVQRIAKDFKVKEVIFAGDRGMLTPKRIEEVNAEDFKSLTALTHPQIQSLIKKDVIKKNQFKDKEIGEVYDPDTPDIRYILCRNPKTAKEETNTRKNLMIRAKEKLDVLKNSNRKRRDIEIASSVGKILEKCKVNKYVDWNVKNNKLKYSFKMEILKKDEDIDGCYIIRTDVSAKQMNKKEAVSGYRSLMLVEQAFRKLKTVLLEMRPFYHKTDDRIRAHIFLCMLSYYVLWHANDMLKPLFENDGKFEKRRWSLDIVIQRLKSITKKEIYIGKTGPISITTTPDSEQKEILKLLKVKL